MIRYNNKVIYGWKICPLTGKVFNETTGEVKRTWLSHGYETYYADGSKFQVHRAIACTYFGVHGRDWDVHHIDGNSLNNRLLNLQWMKHGDHTKKTHTGMKRSEETKALLSEKLKGENHPMYGQHLSQETKEKMSEKKKGKNNPNFGQHHSKETREKMSAKLQGRKWFNNGIIETCRHEKPDETWVEGRLKIVA